MKRYFITTIGRVRLEEAKRYQEKMHSNAKAYTPILQKPMARKVQAYLKNRSESPSNYLSENFQVVKKESKLSK